MDSGKAKTVIDAAKASMGMDISAVDLLNIDMFASRVVALADYRKGLSGYLQVKYALLGVFEVHFLNSFLFNTGKDGLSGSQLGHLDRRHSWSQADLSCRVPHQLGQVSSLHRANSWSRKGTL